MLKKLILGGAVAVASLAISETAFAEYCPRGGYGAYGGYGGYRVPVYSSYYRGYPARAYARGYRGPAYGAFYGSPYRYGRGPGYGRGGYGYGVPYGRGGVGISRGGVGLYIGF